MRIVLYQGYPGKGVPGTDRKRLRNLKADFVCLPEYFFVSTHARTQTDLVKEWKSAKKFLSRLSKEIGSTVVGGTCVVPMGRGWVNRCYVFDRGEELGYYDKIHLYGKEKEAGGKPGKSFKSFRVGRFRIGILICADVFYNESFREMARRRVDVTFIPVSSRYRPLESLEEKFSRDERIFLRGAKLSKSVVVKVCGVGKLFGKRLQGRSLVATPAGILARVKPEDEHKKVVLVVDIFPHPCPLPEGEGI